MEWLVIGVHEEAVSRPLYCFRVHEREAFPCLSFGKPRAAAYSIQLRRFFTLSVTGNDEKSFGHLGLELK